MVTDSVKTDGEERDLNRNRILFCPGAVSFYSFLFYLFSRVVVFSYANSSLQRNKGIIENFVVGDRLLKVFVLLFI